jgi:hypothetical protein
MVATPTSEELIRIIGDLNSEIFDLQAHFEHQETPELAPSLDSVRDVERNSREEANEAAIVRLRAQLEEAAGELARVKQENADVCQLLREQQDANSDLVRRLSEKAKGAFGGATDIEHLQTTIRRLELELRAARDQNSSLVEQAKAKDARFHDELQRLSFHVANAANHDPMVDRAQAQQIAQLESELETMNRTVKSLSDNLTLQVEESRRLHAQVISQKKEFHHALEAQAKECSEASALLMSLQSLLRCSDAPQVVQAVQRLFANDEEARKVIGERSGFERRLSDEIIRNRMLTQKLSEADPENGGTVAHLEAEVIRLRAEAADRESQWRRERDALRTDGQRKDRRIEELQSPAGNAVCRRLADHFEHDFEAGNDLTRTLSALFRQIASAADVDDLVAVIDGLVTTGPNRTADLLTEAFIATSDRLKRYHKGMEDVQQRVEQLYVRLSAARRLTAAVGRRAPAAKGSKIPTIGKVKAPGLEALRPRQFPVSTGEPKERRFV